MCGESKGFLRCAKGAFREVPEAWTVAPEISGTGQPKLLPPSVCPEILVELWNLLWNSLLMTA